MTAKLAQPLQHALLLQRFINQLMRRIDRVNVFAANPIRPCVQPALRRARQRKCRMDCYVYVLGSSGRGGIKTYVGWTLDVARRLTQHNAGRGARSTRGRVWVLLHTECFETRGEAMSREWHLKRDRAFRKQLSQTFADRTAGLGTGPGADLGCLSPVSGGQRSTKAFSITK